MLDLFAVSDIVRNQVKGSVEPRRPAPTKAKPVRRRRAAVRSSSAAALRGLADRLEPSPGR